MRYKDAETRDEINELKLLRGWKANSTMKLGYYAHACEENISKEFEFHVISTRMKKKVALILSELRHYLVRSSGYEK